MRTRLAIVLAIVLALGPLGACAPQQPLKLSANTPDGGPMSADIKATLVDSGDIILALLPRDAAGTRPPAADTTPALALNVPFWPDRTTPRPEAVAQLDQLGKALSSPLLNGRRFVIRVDADIDLAVPESERPSLLKAKSIKEYLTGRYALEDDRIALAAQSLPRLAARPGPVPDAATDMAMETIEVATFVERTARILARTTPVEAALRSLQNLPPPVVKTAGQEEPTRRVIAEAAAPRKDDVLTSPERRRGQDAAQAKRTTAPW